jgi:hypothetical protein
MGGYAGQLIAVTQCLSLFEQAKGVGLSNCLSAVVDTELTKDP